MTRLYRLCTGLLGICTVDGHGTRDRRSESNLVVENRPHSRRPIKPETRTKVLPGKPGKGSDPYERSARRLRAPREEPGRSGNIHAGNTQVNSRRMREQPSTCQWSWGLIPDKCRTRFALTEGLQQPGRNSWTQRGCRQGRKFCFEDLYHAVQVMQLAWAGSLVRGQSSSSSNAGRWENLARII